MAKLGARRGRALTVAFVKSARPGRHGDAIGHGLILRVERSGSRRWTWRGTVNGQKIEIGLGSCRYVTLAEARATAFEYRRLSIQGIDPRDRRASRVTFAETLERLIALNRPSWKAGGRTEEQWRSHAAAYLAPLMRRPVATITARHVKAAIAPLWTTRRNTAAKTLGRVGAVLRLAEAEGLRAAGSDPTRAVRAALPRTTNGEGAHHAAIPYRDLRAALARLADLNALASTKRALRLLALTATRSSEVRLARWREFDLEAAVWTIPAERIKSAREHRVPLAPQAVALLREARADTRGFHPFENARHEPLSPATFGKAWKRLDCGGTPHGLRSAFRSWAADTGVSREVAEAALAHVLPNRTEAAYQRSSLFDSRRPVMEAWADFLLTEPC